MMCRDCGERPAVGLGVRCGPCFRLHGARRAAFDQWKRRAGFTDPTPRQMDKYPNAGREP